MSFTAVTCPELSSPTNGLIAFATDTDAPFDYQTTATYSCNTGFGLSAGDSVRICTASLSGGGEWSGSPLTCEGNEYKSGKRSTLIAVLSAQQLVVVKSLLPRMDKLFTMFLS